ncbi:basic salivary proline-rich protein 2-like [Cavia porcellus]|uniref:basic salivary proline-rich protein 2-like n=1 Tax=Cavia porcellus TaxID=10141 RepID=UPI002FE22E5E
MSSTLGTQAQHVSKPHGGHDPAGLSHSFRRPSRSPGLAGVDQRGTPASDVGGSRGSENRRPRSELRGGVPAPPLGPRAPHARSPPPRGKLFRKFRKRSASSPGPTTGFKRQPPPQACPHGAPSSRRGRRQAPPGPAPAAARPRPPPAGAAAGGSARARPHGLALHLPQYRSQRGSDAIPGPAGLQPRPRQPATCGAGDATARQAGDGDRCARAARGRQQRAASPAPAPGPAYLTRPHATWSRPPSPASTLPPEPSSPAQFREARNPVPA